MLCCCSSLCQGNRSEKTSCVVQDGGLFAGDENLFMDEKPSVFDDFAVKVIDPVKQGEGVAVCWFRSTSVVLLFGFVADGRFMLRRSNDTIVRYRRIFRIKL